MKIILRQSVENLGGPGDVVTVKDGYARNYLIPKKLALPHTPGNLKQVEQEKSRLAAREAKVKAEAEVLATSFAGTHLHFTKKAGEEGVLYGSVTLAEISEAMEHKGLIVDKRRLVIAEPIKRVGDFDVSVRLHPEVELKVMVTVLPEGEEGVPPELPYEVEIQADAAESTAEEQESEVEKEPVEAEDSEADADVGKEVG